MLEAIIIVFAMIFDLAVKQWAMDFLRTLPSQTIVVWPGVFELTYVENRGGAFGILQDQKWFFLIIAFLVVLALVVFILKTRKNSNIGMRITMAFLIAGALGNLIDRAIFGYVRDMFYFRLINFAVFNLADAYIVVGAAFMIFYVLTHKEKQGVLDKEEVKELKEIEASTPDDLCEVRWDHEQKPTQANETVCEVLPESAQPTSEVRVEPEVDSDKKPKE